MKVSLLPLPLKPSRPELLFCLAFDGRVPNAGARSKDAVKASRATRDLATGFRKVSVFHQAARSGPKRLAFIGMGKAGKVSAERLRRAAAIAQQKTEGLKLAGCRLWINDTDHAGVDAFAAGRALAEGLILGAYIYDYPRKVKPKRRQGQRAEVAYSGKKSKEFAAGFRVGVAGANAAVFARDLNNLPGNICTPSYLASQARKLAAPGLKVKVLEERDMSRLKMGALLGVSRGSKQPAKLILLDYRPAGAKQTVCVIGKGLTFDTGGISIKPAARMDEMRYDMCGGGAVLGMFHAIRNGGLRGVRGRTRVIGVVAASENMPGSDAQKPGDIATACDGTTIEVLNTDAEGRLILADAIAYARKIYKPKMMIDLATLTGAVIVALGHEATGIMGNDDDLVADVLAAGEACDEPLWRLPLWDVHREQIKSKFADIANLNSPSHGNGSTSGGAFLSTFVGDTPWVHLDIAGTAWGQRARDYYRGGASGTAVRTLLQWARSLG